MIHFLGLGPPFWSTLPPKQFGGFAGEKESVEQWLLRRQQTVSVPAYPSLCSAWGIQIWTKNADPLLKEPTVRQAPTQ